MHNFCPKTSEHTRSRIVAGHTEEATPEETVRSIEAILSKSPEKRRHRKTHGRISFGDLARTIADKWKTLEQKDKAIFDHYAEIDMLRYRREVKVWKEKKDREEDEKAAYNVQQKQAAFMKSMGNSSFSSLDGSHSSAHSLLESLPYEGSTTSDPQPGKTTSQYEYNSSYSSVGSYGSESSHDFSTGSGMRMPLMMKQQQHLQQLQQQQQQQAQLQRAQLQRHPSAGSNTSDMSSEAAMRTSMLMQQQQQQQQQIQMQMQKHQEHLRQLQQQHQQLQQQQQQLQAQQQGMTPMGGMQQTPQFVQSNQTQFGAGGMMGGNMMNNNNSMSFSNLMGNSSVVSLQSGSHHHDPLLGPSTAGGGNNLNMMQQQQFQQQQQQRHMISGSSHTGSGHNSSSSAYSSFASSHNTGMHSSNSSLYDQQGQPSGMGGGPGGGGPAMMGMNQPNPSAAASSAAGMQAMPGVMGVPGGFNPASEGMPPQRAAFFDGSDHAPRGGGNSNALLDDSGRELEHYMGNMDLSRRNSGM